MVLAQGTRLTAQGKIHEYRHSPRALRRAPCADFEMEMFCLFLHYLCRFFTYASFWISFVYDFLAGGIEFEAVFYLVRPVCGFD